MPCGASAGRSAPAPGSGDGPPPREAEQGENSGPGERGSTRRGGAAARVGRLLFGWHGPCRVEAVAVLVDTVVEDLLGAGVHAAGIVVAVVAAERGGVVAVTVLVVVGAAVARLVRAVVPDLLGAGERGGIAVVAVRAVREVVRGRV